MHKTSKQELHKTSKQELYLLVLGEYLSAIPELFQREDVMWLQDINLVCNKTGHNLTI